MFEIEVRVTGAQATSALLERLQRRLTDNRPALVGIVDQLLQAETERFAGKGQRWKKLAASTIRRDRSGGRDPRLMFLTGELARSLTVRGAPHQIVRVTPSSLTFGTNVWYAKFHARGQGVPRRALVGLTRVQRQSVVAELRRLLLEDA